MGDAPRYRILRRLGQGGMAEVFEAEILGELGFVRRIAIKRMLGDAAHDPLAASRFLDEARIASRLHHANIVAVTDVGLLDGVAFQVLELVDGINAQQLVQRAGGRLPLEIALAIAGQVAHGLEHAHRACDEAGVSLGIVHRDVKPANILISWTGDVKIGDFGIAVARDREAVTATGDVAGTRGFIAPEQLLRSKTDGRTDVFALGLTLLVMVSGNNPMRDLDVELAVVSGQSIPVDASLPSDVRELIRRAIAPARLDRPSAAALAAEIGAALAFRLRRDQRSELRAFLDGLAVQPAKLAAGVLDGLLGVDVVPDDQPAGEVPRFHTVVAPIAGRPTEVATLPARPARNESTAPAPAAPRRRFALGALATLGLGAIGSAGVVWLGPDDDGPVSGAAHKRFDDTNLADIADEASPPAIVVVEEPPVTATAPTSASTPAPQAPPPPPARDVRKVSRPRGASSSPRVDPVVPTPVRSGWLQVYGDQLIGAKVSVANGKFGGYVPNKIEVPLGRHRVVIESRDGTVLPAKHVTLTEFHTSVSPFRITW